MKTLKSFLSCSLFLICSLFTGSCIEAQTSNSSSDIILVGSTPGDEFIKSLLTIPADTKIDFIRWDLTLKNGGKDSKTFLLNINFGEGQPNTNGFIGGGKKITLEGKYNSFHTNKGNLKGEIYQLKSNKAAAVISMVKVNDNLFHLLTPGHKLMIGNGGWSYTLNRKEPVTDPSSDLSFSTSTLLSDTSRQIIFKGRSPCLEIAKALNINVGTECIKAKWSITFYKDPDTHMPTIYRLKRLMVPINNSHRQDMLEGKWAIVRGTETNPDAVIYKLNPDKPDVSISFLIGDENVLFFLDKKDHLVTGNSDFSYTLNKVSKK